MSLTRGYPHPYRYTPSTEQPCFPRISDLIHEHKEAHLFFGVLMTKRTFQPNTRRRAKKHGFRARMASRAGRAILSARRGKGRTRLSA